LASCGLWQTSPCRSWLSATLLPYCG